MDYWRGCFGDIPSKYTDAYHIRLIPTQVNNTSETEATLGAWLVISCLNSYICICPQKCLSGKAKEDRYIACGLAHKGKYMEKQKSGTIHPHLIKKKRRKKEEKNSLKSTPEGLLRRYI